MSIKYLIFIIPCLFFLNHLLTIATSNLRNKKYNKYYKTKINNLNPFNHQQVKKSKWLSPKQIIINLLLLILLSIIYYSNTGSLEFFARLLMGALLIIVLIYLGQNIFSIFSCLLLNKNENFLSGQLTIDPEYALKQSQYQLIIFFIPFLIISFFVNDFLIYGGVLGIVFMFWAHFIWQIKYKSLLNKQNRH